MNFEGNITEKLAVVATIDPDANGAAAYSTDTIDMSKWERVLFIVMVGEMASTSTVDFDVVSDPLTGGSYATTEASITQLTQAGTDSDKQVLVEVRGVDVAANGNRWIKGVLTVGEAASDSAVVALGVPRNAYPAFDNDLASVDEIVDPAS